MVVGYVPYLSFSVVVIRLLIVSNTVPLIFASKPSSSINVRRNFESWQRHLSNITTAIATGSITTYSSHTLTTKRQNVSTITSKPFRYNNFLQQQQQQQQQNHVNHRRTLTENNDELLAAERRDGSTVDDEWNNYNRILIQPFTMFLYPVSRQLSLEDSYFLLSTLEGIIYNYLQSNPFFTVQQSNGTSTLLELDMVRLGNINTGLIQTNSNNSQQGTQKTVTWSSLSSTELFKEASNSGSLMNFTAFIEVEKGMVAINGTSEQIQTLSPHQVNVWVHEALQKSNTLKLLRQQLTTDSLLEFNVKSLKEVYYEFANLTTDRNESDSSVSKPGSNTSTSVPVLGGTTPNTNGHENKAEHSSGFSSVTVVAIAVASIVVASLVAFFIARRRRNSSVRHDVKENELKIGKSNDTVANDEYQSDIESGVIKSNKLRMKNGHGQQYGDTQPDSPDRTVDTNVHMADEYTHVQTITAPNMMPDSVLSSKKSVSFDATVPMHFRASPTPSSWCGSESEWSVSTETNDTKILKSIQSLGHAYGIPASTSSSSFNLLVNDVEIDSNNIQTITALPQSNNFRLVQSQADESGRIITADGEETSATTTRPNRRIVHSESFEMDRPVSIQKDMLANTWAGTFHRKSVLASGDGTDGLSFPLLKSSSFLNKETTNNDGNRINDSTVNIGRTKSIKSKTISTSPRASSSSGESVLQPSHFTVKSERKARKQMVKTQRNELNRRLLANMGICSDDDEDDDIDSPPDLRPWGTGSSVAESDSDTNDDSDYQSRRKMFTEDISNCTI